MLTKQPYIIRINHSVAQVVHYRFSITDDSPIKDLSLQFFNLLNPRSTVISIGDTSFLFHLNINNLTNLVIDSRFWLGLKYPGLGSQLLLIYIAPLAFTGPMLIYTT